ncbi:MAG: hypothetical protein ACTSWY_00975 [Promethearchaeota archaeon]
MAKDKIIGAVIMIVAILIIIGYTIIGPIDLLLESSWAANFSWLVVPTEWLRNLLSWRWALMIPMWLVVFLVGIIAAWIGFSMLTTPPPVPLEELEEELEAEELEEAEESEETDSK